MRGDRITVRALDAGIVVPFLYYGVQALAAPFFPGFSILGTTASELGSDLSKHPALFNVGAILQGVACLIAAIGFFLAFRWLGTHPVIAWPTSIAVAIGGLGSLWAGYYPMPDPRHGGHPAFLVALLALPFLFAITLWRRGHPALKAYLVANLVLLAAVFPIIGGMAGVDTHEYRGIIQRVFALTVFVPIGVAACVLGRRIKAMPE
jgi:hypothetical membrane protein